MTSHPWFEKDDIDAVLMPMGKPEQYREICPLLFQMSSIRGAPVTVPHAVTTESEWTGSRPSP